GGVKVRGVEKGVPTGNGVAVVAANFWAAKRGRDALHLEWSEPEGGGADSDKLLADYRAMAKTAGPIAVEKGKVEDAMKAAKQIVEAEYDVPYLAHATMEPLNCTAK